MSRSNINYNDIGSWLIDFFKDMPPLTDVEGIDRVQLKSIYESLYEFQTKQPWLIIENSFPMRISVRISKSDDDYSPGGIMAPTGFHMFPSDTGYSSSLVDPRPLQDDEMRKYVVVAGR